MPPPAPYGPLPNPRPHRDDKRRSQVERGSPYETRTALWLGTCRVCGTSVLIDDAFVRRDGLVTHTECEAHRKRASLPRWTRRLIALRPGDRE